MADAATNGTASGSYTVNCKTGVASGTASASGIKNTSGKPYVGDLGLYMGSTFLDGEEAQNGAAKFTYTFKPAAGSTSVKLEIDSPTPSGGVAISFTAKVTNSCVTSKPTGSFLATVDCKAINPSLVDASFTGSGFATNAQDFLQIVGRSQNSRPVTITKAGKASATIQIPFTGKAPTIEKLEIVNNSGTVIVGPQNTKVSNSCRKAKATPTPTPSAAPRSSSAATAPLANTGAPTGKLTILAVVLLLVGSAATMLGVKRGVGARHRVARR